MARKTAKSSSARLGRPALKPGSPKRSSFNTRLRADTKKKLEAEARIAGRSLSEEIEFRLEQSFRDKAALIEALGGRDTYDILRVMGSIAAHIQTRTGKTATDWKTGLAIGRAWKRLIHDWVPRPPAEWIAELYALSDDIPDAPVLPEQPEAPIRGGLLSPRASEEEWEAYRAKLPKLKKEWEAFSIELTKYERGLDRREAKLSKKLGEISEAAEIGEEALGLLSDQEK